MTTSVNFENDYLWQWPWSVNFLQLFFFLKKTAEAHICFVNLMHRSAWWLQSRTCWTPVSTIYFKKNSHILGWFPLLISLLFSLLLVFILKNIASLFNKVGYFKDFKIVIHICRWQLPVYFEYSVLLSYALSRSRRKYIGTHKTYSVNEQPWLQKQIISSMANVQWRTLWWLIAQDS